MPIITIANNKGGVTKTTVALNLASGLARMGKRVLMIDLDSQANLTSACGVIAKDHAAAGMHIGRVLIGEITPLQGTTQVTPDGNLNLIPAPADRKLLSYEEQLYGRMQREFTLQKALKDYTKGFHYVIIDTPPQLGLLTNMALFASNSYIIPMVAESFDYEGLSSLIGHVNDIQEYVDITLGGVVLSKYNPKMRKALVQTIAKAITSDPEYKAFRTYIRENVAIQEAQHLKQSLFEYAPDSNGAADFSALTLEVIERYVR